MTSHNDLKALSRRRGGLMTSLMTVEEITRRVNLLKEFEIERMEKTVGRHPACKCEACTLGWKVNLNRFLRVAEAARN